MPWSNQSGGGGPWGQRGGSGGGKSPWGSGGPQGNGGAGLLAPEAPTLPRHLQHEPFARRHLDDAAVLLFEQVGPDDAFGAQMVANVAARVARETADFLARVHEPTLADDLQIEVAPASKSDGRTCDVLIADEDITWETRLPEVDANVSVVSAYAGVRREMSQQQRRIGQRGRRVQRT